MRDERVTTGTIDAAADAETDERDARRSEIVLGRPAGEAGPTADLGTYRAADGSDGAPVGVDLDRPHVGLVVGKRGYGKSYTLGVLAEEAARAPGVAPVVCDPMGAFDGLAAESADGASAVPAEVIGDPSVRADALPPRAWPGLVGLDPAGAAGSLVWRAAAESETLDGMREAVAGGGTDTSTDTGTDAGSDAATADVRRAAANHLRLAASWGAFDPDGLDATDLASGAATVLDLSGLPPAAANAVVAVAASGLYEARVAGTVDRLPWLLVDEAHAFFGGAAAEALRRVVTRGRAPGVSLAAATQRPSALPDVAVSQADLLAVHRLTAESDLDALAAARPTYLREGFRGRTPTDRGAALVVDDATESVHGVRVRTRDTPHGGGSSRASETAAGAAGRAADAAADGFETPEYPRRRR